MEDFLSKIEKIESNKNFHILKNKLNFENYTYSSLKLSKIENKENDEQTKKFDSINSYNFDITSNINKTNEEKLKPKNIKLTKENFNNIPLPIFSCIYCSNEKIAFGHFIKEKIYDKYFFQTSVYDMKLLDKVINLNPIIDHYNKNPPLIEIIIRQSEFIRNFYDKNKINNFFTSEKFKKITEDNIFIITKKFMQKIEYKFIWKRNGELHSNKYNSNKLTHLDENKISYRKIINSNITFTNYYLSTNKNSITNTFNGSASANTGLSQALNNYESITNNINTCFNQNNIMRSIIENIEKNEESDGKTDEKFLDILKEKKKSARRINKNDINFEQKCYNIWNPDITLIEEEEDFKNINYLSERSIKNVGRIINYIHKSAKQNKNMEEYIMNDYNENKRKTKIVLKKDIFSAYMNNNLKKRKLKGFINCKNKRNLNIDSLFSKQKFFIRDTKNNNKCLNFNLEKIKNIITKKTIKNFSKTISQPNKKNNFYVIKPYPDSRKDKNQINMEYFKLIKKAANLSIKNNIFNSTKNKNLTIANYLNADLKGLKYNSINNSNDLRHKRNDNINIDINLNNKNLDSSSKCLRIPTNPLLSSLLKEKISSMSLPNLSNNIPRKGNYRYKNNINLNLNKKIRIKKNLIKINPYNFSKKRCVSLSNPSKKNITNVNN